MAYIKLFSNFFTSQQFCYGDIPSWNNAWSTLPSDLPYMRVEFEPVSFILTQYDSLYFISESLFPYCFKVPLVIIVRAMYTSKVIRKKFCGSQESTAPICYLLRQPEFFSEFPMSLRKGTASNYFWSMHSPFDNAIVVTPLMLFSSSIFNCRIFVIVLLDIAAFLKQRIRVANKIFSFEMLLILNKGCHYEKREGVDLYVCWFS